MADDLDADWKQDHSAIMPSLTKYLKKGGIYFVRCPAARVRPACFRREVTWGEKGVPAPCCRRITSRQCQCAG
eukprot:SAG25_NODE_6566_length_550_cov_0.667406_1_plen_72_part_10